LARAVSSGSRIAVREQEADLVVARRDEVAEGVVSLTLAGPDGEQLPGWTPGAHVDLVLDEGLVRQYSLCSDPNDGDKWRVGILRDPSSRGGSVFVHDELQEGSTVRVRGPRNHFPLVSADRYLFIAGGIGITPILPMIEEAEASGAGWELVYGGRQRSSMAFVDELEQHGDRVRICPQDEVGMLDLESILGTPRDDTLVYCCGPEPLLNAVEEACKDWPDGSLHIERFAPKEVSEEEREGALDTFEVVCQRSGVSVRVPPDKSILEAVEEEGIDVLASCCEGVCGTCETGVVEGTPDHRDSLLNEAEREAGEIMMICVSRSRSEKLVLDL
jgi:ferredoxin-NADP reductase